MATMAADPVFVDTNILVYAAIASAPFHGPAFGKLFVTTGSIMVAG
jgi:predicted nucleic acid-binding protein